MSDLDVSKSILQGPVPSPSDVSDEEFTRLVWALRGIVKEQERERAFWAATNDNLTDAFLELEKKDGEIEAAYKLIRDDLEVAARVQQALLPRPFEEMHGDLDIAIFHRQLADVGGDYYDFFSLESGGYAVGVFDISGHGVASALVMTYLKVQFMAAINAGLSPAGTVGHVNRVALSFLRRTRKYATVNYVQFGRQELTYVNGGGNGLIVRASGATEFTKRDQFLGIRTQPYHEFQELFAPGDLLALYTDGIYEAQDKDFNDYTKRRLNELILANSHLPVQELAQACKDDYERFRNADSDDITLLLLRKRGKNDN